MQILDNNIAIILAAGSGTRANLNLPKQFEILGDKPILNWSIDAFLKSKKFKKIIVVLPQNHDENLWTNSYADKIEIVFGGKERNDSVSNALNNYSEANFEHIFIHDAARPGIDIDYLNLMIENFSNDIDGIIPVLNCNDAMWLVKDELLFDNIDRVNLKRAQTPQAFKFKKYLNARKNSLLNNNIFDDAQISVNYGLKVKYMEGNQKLDKITFKSDFQKMDNILMSETLVSRNGIGFDAHKFCEGKELILCGVKIPYEFGLDGHSDADVAWHALVDAILGAIGEGDIGQAFPPSEAKWKGAPSSVFLEYARDKVNEKNALIENIDLSIICEAPKIGPYREELRISTAKLLRINTNNVNIKATTTEKMGFTGRKEGIAAMASATILMKRGKNVF